MKHGAKEDTHKAFPIKEYRWVNSPCSAVLTFSPSHIHTHAHSYNNDKLYFKSYMYFYFN